MYAEHSMYRYCITCNVVNEIMITHQVCMRPFKCSKPGGDVYSKLINLAYSAVRDEGAVKV